MENVQKEKMKHFGMDLEFLLRKKPLRRATLQAIVFTTGNIIEMGKKGEKAAGE